MASLIPWSEFEAKYALTFSAETGIRMSGLP